MESNHDRTATRRQEIVAIYTVHAHQRGHSVVRCYINPSYAFDTVYQSPRNMPNTRLLLAGIASAAVRLCVLSDVINTLLVLLAAASVTHTRLAHSLLRDLSHSVD